MPMHDWTRVEAGIYHHFHLEWISRITAAVNSRLPPDYYALAEQFAAGFGPHVLTLRNDKPDEIITASAATTLERPKTKYFQETDSDFYLRKKNSTVIRHVCGDRVVAMIEIVSPGNKNSAHGLRSFLLKVRELLIQKIHLLIIDPFPISQRVPYGLHALVYEDFEDEPVRLTNDKPLSTIAYECDESLRAYLEPFAVGDSLMDMPVFLYPGMYIEVPLEETYMSAWKAVPRRWQEVISPAEQY
ncbi:MAG: hypothetical protein JWM11_7293 [Planctomycetaceae bacterium]|nr:hypothetical protein [Planctomycetaceae bacterium]